MKEIIALKEYTDKYISLYEGEIRNINEPLAERLIEQGVVAQHEDESGSGSDDGSSSALPEVTVDDNGKVLKVVNGAWNKADADMMVVPVFTVGQDEAYHCNIAFNELLELTTSGKCLGALAENTEDEYTAYMLMSTTSESIIFSEIEVKPKSDDPTTIEILFFNFVTLNSDESVNHGLMRKAFN